MKRLAILFVLVAGCSDSRGTLDAGSNRDAGSVADAGSSEVPVEVQELCAAFEAAGCPIGMPFGYGERDCAEYFLIRARRSDRTGCTAEEAAYFRCLEELPSACNASSCTELGDAVSACWMENPGGDTCSLACEASMTEGCSFTVNSCLGWCTRQETLRAISDCATEGETLDDCQAALSDVCAAETCSEERGALTSCEAG